MFQDSQLTPHQRDTDIVAKIKAASDNKLTKILDPICLPGTTELVTEWYVPRPAPCLQYSDTDNRPGSFGPTGGKLHNLRYTDMSAIRKDVSQAVSAGYAVFGKPWALKGNTFPGLPEDRVHSARFWSLAGDLAAAGKLKPHPIKVMPGGLAGVAEGMKMQKEWKLSAEKLVYLIRGSPSSFFLSFLSFFSGKWWRV